MNINNSLSNGRDLLYQISQNQIIYKPTLVDNNYNLRDKQNLLGHFIKNCFSNIRIAENCATHLLNNEDEFFEYDYTYHRYSKITYFKHYSKEEISDHLSDNVMYNCTSIAHKIYEPNTPLTDEQANEVNSIKQFLYYKLTHTVRDLNREIIPFKFENETKRNEGKTRINKFFSKLLNRELKSSEQKEMSIELKRLKYGEEERELIEDLQNNSRFTNDEKKEILNKVGELLTHLKSKNITNPHSKNVKDHLLVALESIRTELNQIKPDWTKVNWNSFTNENINNILSNDHTQIWNELKNNFISLIICRDELAKVQNKIQSLHARYVPQATIQEIPARSTPLPPKKIENEILYNHEIKSTKNDETRNSNNRKSFSVFNSIGNGLIAVKNGFIAFVKMLWPFGKKS